MTPGKKSEEGKQSQKPSAKRYSEDEILEMANKNAIRRDQAQKSNESLIEQMKISMMKNQSPEIPSFKKAADEIAKKYGR